MSTASALRKLRAARPAKPPVGPVEPVTVEQAAAYLSVHRSTIYRHFAAGLLTRWRLGGRVYCDLHEIRNSFTSSPNSRGPRRGRQT